MPLREITIEPETLNWGAVSAVLNDWPPVISTADTAAYTPSIISADIAFTPHTTTVYGRTIDEWMQHMSQESEAFRMERADTPDFTDDSSDEDADPGTVEELMDFVNYKG